MILDADKMIAEFYDRMWGKQDPVKSKSTITLATKYTEVLDKAGGGGGTGATIFMGESYISNGGDGINIVFDFEGGKGK